MVFKFIMPDAAALSIAKSAQARRLAQNMSQKTLSERSGVSLGTLKKFEATGKISLISLLKIALTLGSLEEFDALFSQEVSESASLDQLLKAKKRKRGRQ